MPGKLTAEKMQAVEQLITSRTNGDRTTWCRDVLGYLGEFKWAGNNPDWSATNTENLAMNCWCAPIYIAHRTGRLTKKSVDDFNLLPFQYPKLSPLHQSQRAAYEYLKGVAASPDEGIPGDLIFFYIDSLKGVFGSNAYSDSVPVGECPVHVAVNMGPGECVSLWSTPNDYDKYQLCTVRELIDAIERDRKANCSITSIAPFWIMGTTNKKKSCYVTTAVCRSRGLADDCRELAALRWFRDHVVSTTAAGRAEIADYYANAPSIVASIERRGDRARIYQRIYEEHLAPAVAAIEAGRHEEARARIRRAIADLGNRFGTGGCRRD